MNNTKFIFNANKRTVVYLCDDILEYLGKKLQEATEEDTDMIIQHIAGLTSVFNYLILNVDSERYDDIKMLDHLCAFMKYLEKYPDDRIKSKAERVFEHLFDAMDITFSVLG